MDLEILGFVISAISIVISILAFFYAWKAYRRDTSYLEIAVEFEPLSSRGKRFVIEIVNVGRRPTEIKEIHFGQKSTKPILVFNGNRDGTNPRLEEAETYSCSIPLTILEGYTGNPLDFRHIEVRDSMNNSYLYSGRSWGYICKYQNLKRRIKEIQKPE